MGNIRTCIQQFLVLRLEAVYLSSEVIVLFYLSIYSGYTTIQLCAACLCRDKMVYFLKFVTPRQWLKNTLPMPGFSLPIPKSITQFQSHVGENIKTSFGKIWESKYQDKGLKGLCTYQWQCRLATIRNYQPRSDNLSGVRCSLTDAFSLKVQISETSQFTTFQKGGGMNYQIIIIRIIRILGTVLRKMKFNFLKLVKSLFIVCVNYRITVC